MAYINHLLDNIPSITKTVSIWSDGPSSQFKNRFIVAALKSLQEKHNIQITWNFFATSHGKGPVDGIGGAVKRQVWNAVKTRKHIVTDAKSFVAAAMNYTNVKVVEMTASDIEERNISLNVTKVFEAASPIPGIAAIHSVKIDKDKLIVHALTENADYNIISEDDNTLDNGTESDASNSTNEEHCVIGVGDWYAVEYEGRVYPGEVRSVEEANDFQVSVMVRANFELVY